MSSILSIIVPLAPGENHWKQLLSDLEPLEDRAEILFVVANPDSPSPKKHELEERELPRQVRVISAERGRAAQLNAGARAARGAHLLFLHADSRLSTDTWAALFESLRTFPDRLHYFNLRFQSDGPALMPLNEWGVWLRSHWLGIPFGDQGFCLGAKQFERVGPFDESLACGEDHTFVWTARLRGLRLHCTGATLETSARKYRERGWLGTTLLHLILTFRQAVPFWWQLTRKRWLS